jgi:hypothetical protein
MKATEHVDLLFERIFNRFWRIFGVFQREIGLKSLLSRH